MSLALLKTGPGIEFAGMTIGLLPEELQVSYSLNCAYLK
jgi:hypothetical protein